MYLEPCFTENRGQMDADKGLPYAHGQRMAVSFSPSHVTYVLDQDDGANVWYRVVFEGCNEVIPVGSSATGHSSNFFIGNEPSKWVSGARNFAEVIYDDLWEDIDRRG